MRMFLGKPISLSQIPSDLREKKNDHQPSPFCEFLMDWSFCFLQQAYINEGSHSKNGL